MSKSLISLAVTAFILGGCSLIPEYKQPQAPVAAQYPQGPAYSLLPKRPRWLPPSKAGASSSVIRRCNA